MAVDRNEPDEITPAFLHKQTPTFVWAIGGSLALIMAGLAFYLTRHTHEHVAPGKYVGPGQCKECHPKQYESWEKTRMASSFAVLRPGEKVNEKKLVGLDPAADYTHSEACLPCHATAFGLVGGFVSIESTPDMAGVTCEGCHGPGGSYAGTVMNQSKPSFETADARKAGLVYPPTEEVCKVCHNEHSPFAGINHQFIFEERVKRGTHEHFKLKYEHGR